jgi:hypothetical protein
LSGPIVGPGRCFLFFRFFQTIHFRKTSVSHACLLPVATVEGTCITQFCSWH